MKPQDLIPHLYPGYAPKAPVEEKDLPRVPQDLVEMLQARFPNKLPAIDADLGRLRFLQGQVSVVQYLAAVALQQRGGSAKQLELPFP